MVTDVRSLPAPTNRDMAELFSLSHARDISAELTLIQIDGGQQVACLLLLLQLFDLSICVKKLALELFHLCSRIPTVQLSSCCGARTRRTLGAARGWGRRPSALATGFGHLKLLLELFVMPLQILQLILCANSRSVREGTAECGRMHEP